MWLLSLRGMQSGQKVVHVPARTEVHGMPRAVISPVSFHVYVLGKTADTKEQLCHHRSDEGFRSLWPLWDPLQRLHQIKRSLNCSPRVSANEILELSRRRSLCGSCNGQPGLRIKVSKTRQYMKHWYTRSSRKVHQLTQHLETNLKRLKGQCKGSYKGGRKILGKPLKSG